MVVTIHILMLLLLTVFSYGFIDANFPYRGPGFLFDLIHHHRLLTTIIYSIIVTGLFATFLLLLRQTKKLKVDLKKVKKIILITVVILFFSFPAFSNDIFNYIAAARVTFLYKENPYLTMPIEFAGDPLLPFMHAANKTALYGPSWILLTAIPYFFGIGNLLLTIFTFKIAIVFFYLGTCWLIWRLTDSNLTSLVFFSLNPLVLIESLVSSHNDIVMMAFILLALYLNFKKQKLASFISFILSAGIKFATAILLPIFFLQKKISKEQLFQVCYWLMFFVFLAAPFREEIYPWYVIWLVSFAALVPKKKFIFWLTLSLSFGTLFRYTPFFYTREWGGLTPMIKKIVTVMPLVIVFLVFFWKKLWLRISSLC